MSFRNIAPIVTLKISGKELTLRPTMVVGAVLLFALGGCDPVVGLAGATFPVWILCLLLGIVTAIAMKPILVATGIDEWMTPKPLVYASLALTIAFGCWLLIWR
jgi:YtcA family